LLGAVIYGAVLFGTAGFAIGAAAGGLIGLATAKMTSNQAGAWTFLGIAIVGLLVGLVYGVAGAFRAQLEDERNGSLRA
jgi:hypothetical protein